MTLRFKRASPALRSAPTRVGNKPTPQASLEVWNGDPLALVRVLDARGRVVAEGRERVKLQNLKPGVYRAQLLVPDGAVVEQAVSVDEGEHESIMLKPGAHDIDSARLGQLRRRFGFRVNEDDGSPQVSETLGAPRVAFPDLTTLMAMGLAAGVLGEKIVPSYRLIGLRLNAARALPRQRGRSAVLQVVLADDSTIKDDFLKARVDVRMLDTREPHVSAAMTLAQRLTNVSELATSITPGTWVLDLLGQGTAVPRFVLPTFSGQVTNLVLHRQGPAR